MLLQMLSKWYKLNIQVAGLDVRKYHVRLQEMHKINMQDNSSRELSGYHALRRTYAWYRLYMLMTFGKLPGKRSLAISKIVLPDVLLIFNAAVKSSKEDIIVCKEERGTTRN